MHSSPMARFNIICFLGIFNVLLLIKKGDAFEFKVGGSQGTWAVPADPKSSEYNQWAERNRFQVGDSLLFVYAADQDSVLHVTKDDYTNCKTTSPIAKYSDGHTVIKLNESGAHYFISGVDDNCHKNEKLVVVVLADRSKRSPPPAPAVETPPPSPAPSGEESPSPPSDEGTNPTAAPSQEASPPNNGVSSIVRGVVGTIGVALLGSSLVLAI
ncbi:early nodulin-like protein 9 [Henckelia pumila]|uniref:early nodulin-like protein 9 n=1 Tax=Henckelia pumila TaxID=405737 RepID=UPI003C6E0418